METTAGPPELFDRLCSWMDTCAVIVAAQLGVADHLTDDVPRSAKEVAAELDLDETATGRLLEILTASGVARHRGPDRFLLGPAGAALRSDVPGSLRSLLRMVAGTIGAAVLQGALTLRTGTPAFDQIAGMNVFEYLAAHPDEGSIFNASMADLGVAIGLPAIRAYDFSGVRTLVDVGGGRGQLTLEVLRTNPGVEGVVFDAPHVAAEAEAEIERAGLAGRCRVVGGNFFTSVPAGDCIALRSVIHNWDDERAVQILRRCREAIRPGGRLLLFEVVLPEADGPHLAKTIDWVMLTVAAGRERTQAAHSALLERAGFQLARVISTASPMSVIEAVPV